MTPRERFRRALRFQRPGDRLPMIEWAAWWDKTIRRWEDEGFPRRIGWEGSVRYFRLDPIYNVMARPYSDQTPPQWYGGIVHEAAYETVLPFLYRQEEVDVLLPLMRSGGYVLSVDHQTPPGVSLEQY